MFSTPKKTNQQKNQLSQLDETLNGFAIGNCVNVSILKSENLEQLTNGRSNDFKRADKSVCQNQVIENRFDEQVTRAVSGALMTVKIRMHDASLRTIDNVVTPRVDMAVKSITGFAWLGESGKVRILTAGTP